MSTGRDETLSGRHERAAALCGPCRGEWKRWLDYRLPRKQRWICIAGGNPVRHSLYNIEANYRTWRDTIRTMQAIIEEHCAEAHQRDAVDAGEPVPVGPVAPLPETIRQLERATGGEAA